MGSRASRDPTATLTHARLRISQGDLKAARRVLRAIPEHSPDRREAGLLLKSIAGRAERKKLVVTEEIPAAPQAGSAVDLAGRFKAVLGRTPGNETERKIERLRSFLVKIVASRSSSRI